MLYNEMTGRLLGDSTLPPEDPAEWKLNEKTIYGCTLCHILNNPESDAINNLHELRQVNGGLDVEEVKYELQPVEHHGPSLDLATLTQDGPVSICVSMGHIYLRNIDIKDVNLSRYMMTTDSNRITVVNEDLPLYSLIYHNGVLYNLTASVITNFEAELSLINLAKAHHKLSNARTDPNVYETERYEFIKLMDEYLAPPEVKTDTMYGIKTVKFLVEHIDFKNSPRLKLNKIMEDSAMGTVYTVPFINDHFVLKYQRLEDDYDLMVWENERVNNEYINKNLQSRPDLPYPYMYRHFRCGEIWDLGELKTPTCPDGDEEIGVFLQEYIESVGSLESFIRANPDVKGLAVYFEAMATLAEAHQGDTVQHHFMHLDAHGKNFLISECGPKVRSCDNRHSRISDFGGFKFKFGTLGGRVFLIDYGLSHFLDTYRKEPINSDLPNVEFGNKLYPAFDMITLQRGMFSLLFTEFVSNFLKDKEKYTPMFNAMTKTLLITTLLGAVNIIGMVMTRYEDYGPPTLEKNMDPASLASIFNVRNLVVKIHDLLDTENVLEEVQLFLYNYIKKISKKIFEADDSLMETSFNAVIQFLCGFYLFRAYKRGVMKTVLIRTIRQTDIMPLSDKVLEKLKIPQAPAGITGIPLLLWYVNKYSIRLPIVEE